MLQTIVLTVLQEPRALIATSLARFSEGDVSIPLLYFNGIGMITDKMPYCLHSATLLYNNKLPHSVRGRFTLSLSLPMGPPSSSDGIPSSKFTSVSSPKGYRNE